MRGRPIKSKGGLHSCSCMLSPAKSVVYPNHLPGFDQSLMNGTQRRSSSAVACCVRENLGTRRRSQNDQCELTCLPSQRFSKHIIRTQCPSSQYSRSICTSCFLVALSMVVGEFWYASGILALSCNYFCPLYQRKFEDWCWWNQSPFVIPFNG
jgi:hypothetical protein